jgi:diacylglycerol kinase (ATP)
MPPLGKLLFVINKKAGRKNNIDYETEIKHVFKYAEFFFMVEENPKEKLRAEIEKIKPKIVVAVGGDGTITFVAEIINGTDIAMGIIPTGSANGMAKELNIPTDINNALKILENGSVEKVDLVWINNQHICFHLSDVGLNARLIKYFEEGKVRGKLGYFKALVKTMFRRKRLFASVKTREKEITREATMILIANATKYGTGVLVNPKGNISDGFFEVVILRKIKITDLLKMILKFKRFYSDQIEIIEASKTTITSRRKMHFQVDGEYKGKVKEVTAEIMPGALNVILPHKS